MDLNKEKRDGNRKVGVCIGSLGGMGSAALVQMRGVARPGESVSIVVSARLVLARARRSMSPSPETMSVDRLRVAT